MSQDETSIGEAQAFATEFAKACDHEDRGEIDQAVTKFRLLAERGHEGALINLANLLIREERQPGDRKEGLRWLYRGARAGNETAAWNLAMEHRLRGNRRRYFHWLRVAAELGEPDAKRFLGVIERIRARGQHAPMLFLDAVDEMVVRLVLGAFLAGRLNRAGVVEWARPVARGEAALGPCQSRRVAEAVDELADASRRLTKRRARELYFKLS